MKFKKALSVAVAAALSGAFALSGLACGGDDTWSMPKNTEKYDIPQDYCRTYYEVFVRSFADGNGDGIGDIKGLINNLDYLNDGDDSTMDDLGINGIWMMPINSSPSYHKYDVTDYYNIDDEYGTLEDFDELVKECNKRNIWLQMDLVLNHTSSRHPWFTEAVADANNGLEPDQSEAMQRYIFVHKDDVPTSGTYRKVAGSSDYYYLGNFDSGMPDLNLANTEVREEIKKIVDFWLERGVRSFRLDAVPWACANDVIYSEENAEFWTWFNDYCNEKGAEIYGKEGDGIARYCYNVGEVWADNNTVVNYFGTGMSNFNYGYDGGTANSGFAQVANAQASRAIAANLVNNMANTQAAALAKDPDAILSNFLTNHDNDRLSAMFGSAAKLKSAASLYMLMPGNCYIYYGDEIGAKGTGDDPSRRLPFNWGDGRYNIKNPPGANYDGNQDYGTVSGQKNSADSILTYYRYVVQMRNRFPEIARGKMTAYAVDNGGELATSEKVRENLGTNSITTVNEYNRNVAAYTLTWNGKTLLLVHNFGSEATIGVSAFGGYGIAGTLLAGGGSIKLESGKLTLPSNSVAVLRAS